ncbi:hypothetical protein [Aeoliella sp.]|uniref:hypothetical protein n=1 Tax=Aeoliella sp. TaxID=2795800 RepID=UPI003CCBA8A4
MATVSSNRCGASLVALVALTLSGCSQDEWGYVSGVVTANGSPVGPGTLVFEPSDPERLNKPSSLGYFDASGKFSLVSAGGKKGAPVGNYRIKIMAGGPESLADEAAAVEAQQKPTPIPSKYFSHDGGLTATIKDGEQEINFDLES